MRLLVLLACRRVDHKFRLQAVTSSELTGRSEMKLMAIASDLGDPSHDINDKNNSSLPYTAHAIDVVMQMTYQASTLYPMSRCLAALTLGDHIGKL